ncbi:unnamed protein product [Schistosoma mattheei]|uniref:Uncharacterized protein n=1 Tax=Schistosoma mattheei TaxID=31246 RepID=A0A183PYB6_9TREM|nr:unnamed protein product [Schistosoma mattheei]
MSRMNSSWRGDPMSEFDGECWLVVYGPGRVVGGVSRYKTEEVGHMRTPNHLVAFKLSVIFHTSPEMLSSSESDRPPEDIGRD